MWLKWIISSCSLRSLEYAFLGYNSHHKGYLCLDIHSVPLSIPLPPISPSPSNSPSISHSFSSSSSSISSTCSPLVAPTSFPFFSHSMSPSVPPHFPLPHRVDLHVPSVDTYLLASSRTHNIHPMVTRSKAGIYKPKLLLSVSIVMRTSINTL
ncbi:hypothetical protein CK203_087058 [Vitis vinifera]|uniref:Uncharacterized protein n=1 Tax=Vitis vinifera TaxID=29760 RepID=A0A438EAJ0_VITVI|nr:hypothetical protein CK203_087058 [Vitis vinifera]